MIAIKNIMIYDYYHFIKNGYVIFDEKIREVGLMSDFSYEGEIVDGEGKLLLPGLINSHTHIYSTLFRGLNMNVSPTDFRGVLDEIWWKFDKELDIESIELSAKVYAEESLSSGVTSLIDHHASGEIKGSVSCIDTVLSDIGMKHLLCFETSDRFNIDDCIYENKYALDKNGYFGLHASLSLSDDTLMKVSKYIEDRPVHVHVAESMQDQEDSLKKYDKRVVKRLDSFNILNKDSILAHCIHIDDEEAEIISRRGCYVAINPTSNMNNAVGLYDYDIIKNHSINVLVGTDGLGVNVAKEWQSLFYIGKQSVNNPSGVDLNWIKSSLMNSYNYFNRRLGCKLGQIKEGYSSDFILIDYKTPTPINKENIFFHVFFSVFDGLKANTVYTDGILRIHNYKRTQDIKFDEELADSLWQRIGGKS